MTACQTIDALRTSVRALEVGDAECLRTLSFGSAQADGIFGRTFLCGRTHEIGGSAATLFAALVLGRCEGPTLWCARDGAPSALYPPGLVQTGFDPDRLVLVRLRAADDLLHAAHAGLRAGWHVVLERAKPFDLSAARRLQLACEAGGGLGFVLDSSGPNAAALLPSATTRWQATVTGGALWPCALRLKLHLLRNRTGLPGQWTVEWDYGSRAFSVVSASCDRPADTPRAVLA